MKLRIKNRVSKEILDGMGYKWSKKFNYYINYEFNMFYDPKQHTIKQFIINHNNELNRILTRIHKILGGIIQKSELNNSKN